ncbi:nicotinate-nucleotide--dimethylbenzimidazole phosphoribosyltransferase [Streptomyces sp. 150FB]|uniref:nicotinate-nucleotide--dimethylbenzimidazole phosphoribosyltransferase n=1 Tax=Streptomyces sp. 150FB TaxID=1576605 RepID=UPI00058913C1|nr:nicotinate-nucleotide--dimethylbenzimidazole phosphoribosyltransferase [Streptomyces sp. 150FB]KIF73580.1 nicotinate-nucleotide--dimethylbenzimidazole phosphoribosyltransferase [Streptomyces sp. 150FB]
MTDTGQIPGEVLPENAGTVEEQGSLASGSGSGAGSAVGASGVHRAPGVEGAASVGAVGAQGAQVLDAYGSSYPGASESAPEDEDLLLMPSAQGAWGDPQPVPSDTSMAPMAYATPVATYEVPGAYEAPAVGPVVAPVGAPVAAPVAYAVQAQVPPIDEPAPVPAPEPVAEMAEAQQFPASYGQQAEPVAESGPVAEQGAHEAGGRDSGSVDLSAVRIPPLVAEPETEPTPEPDPALVSEPVAVPEPEPVAVPVAVAVPAPAPTPVRRPLHMGPPVPDATGGVVRSLADRGPAGAAVQVAPVTVPAPVPAPAPVSSPVSVAVPVPVPVSVPEPEPAQEVESEPVAGLAPGPEYLDVPQEDATVLPGPQLADIPAQASAPWTPEPPAETVVPEPVAEEAVVVAEETPEVVSVDAPVEVPDVPVAVVAPEVVEEPEAVAEVAVSEPVPEPVPEPVSEVVVEEPEDSAGEVLPDPEVPVVVETAPELAPELAPEAVAEPELAPEPEPLPAAASGYDDAERDTVLRVMRERRDIRNGFRSDPIPHEVLLRVLEAAHTAPSVGHSQPWDFVVIRSAETRRSMHELAQRQRDAYAKSLPKGRAKQFKELKIEAILDTPVNIVVTADPTRGGRHTLGRHTQPQMAPYSSALAVENLWLASRAEGLGVGWVSFFDEREMVRALGLPEHLEVVAYLCVGYVDEFPEEPELMQAGWSKRRPLSWVVHEETYGRRALPGEQPHDLLQETISTIRPLDAKALGEAWERQKRMTKPAGALGMLEIISAQLSGLSRMCPPPIPEPAAVAIFAGDHGVHAQGVTPWPQEVTAQMVANFLGGGAVCNAFAAQVGAEVCVIDVGVASELPATPGLLPRKVRAATADFTTGPAMSREEVLKAVNVGIETARDLVAAGNKALITGEMGIANTTVSAALISVYTDADPAEVTGRGTGINDETHARKVDVVRRGLELHRPDPADPIGVMAAVGGLEHAALVGFILGGASMRTPVILDGVSAGAAALVARAIAPEALAACIAGHRSAEPGHLAALNKLGLRPLVDLDLRLGEGTGALLALPVVQSAARAMHEVATFDSAGVTEK